jgi:hypothetical protein
MAYRTRSHAQRRNWPAPQPRFVLAAALAVCVLLLSTGPQSAVDAMAIADQRFGAVETYANPAAATELGAGWTRVAFEWARIQPNGTHEWNVVPISDDALSTEIAQGREVVGLLITTPAWATDKERGGGVPQGLYLPIDDPDNLWANFVRAIVTRYAGRINHWTIWNEPEISPGSPDVTWGGSTEDFIQLLRVAYLVAKAENPNAVIHMAGMSHWHNNLWFGQFLDLLVADPQARPSNFYFDVATLHLYHEPEKIYDITALYYNQMRERDIYKPIWIAETNAYLSRVSENEQAYFIFQAFALEIAAGAQRVGVYKMADAATDSAADPEQFGLVRIDGGRRPADDGGVGGRRVRHRLAKASRAWLLLHPTPGSQMCPGGPRLRYRWRAGDVGRECAAQRHNGSPARFADAVQSGGHPHAHTHAGPHILYHSNKHADPHADGHPAAHLYPDAGTHVDAYFDAHPHPHSPADFGHSRGSPLDPHWRAGTGDGRRRCDHRRKEIPETLIHARRNDRQGRHRFHRPAGHRL